VDEIELADGPAELHISRTLFGGLLASIVVMLLGLLLVALEGRNAASHVVPLDRVLPDLARGSRPAVLDFGILLLFATPLLGVVVAFAGFLREGDREFSLLTAALLIVLAAGFAVALR
jgi:uncharacterized membrane protein